MHVVYMLRCSNNSLYTGYTTDLARRYAAHLSGKCKYTRSFKPVGIAHYWFVDGDKANAMRVERYIKALSRETKEALLRAPASLSREFPWVHEMAHPPLTL